MSAKILNYISNRLHAKRFKLLCKRCYTEVVTESKKYTDTINLPKTAFPLRLNSKSRVLNDEYIRETCGFDQLYSWQREHLEGPEFILHDGPPYANGEPHMGHAINKILKDITLRRRVISGQRVHYVPGWDCHGLPIEMKALARDGGSDLDPLEIRKRARQFALNTIKSQQEAFKSWGIMGDWTTEGTYRTLDPEYIKQQLGAFWELHEKGLIYRDLKPVYWSPSSRTALAEAELEYDNNHISPSLTFQVRLVDLPPNIQNIVGTNTPVWALVWTTTPWTLPSNQAICYNENMVYSLVEIDGRPGLFLVATELIDDLQTLLEKRISVDNNFLGTTCAGITYIPPFGTRVQPFLPSNHVSLSKGTGLVHAAPAHGPDDFLVAKSNKMSLKCVVDETGCYTCDAPDFLHGLSVITEGTEAVLNSIQENIVHLEMLTHKYPIDWRTKEPVILRASYQWFIDTDKLKEIAVNELEAVNVHPNHSSFSNTRGLLAQLRKRPYWCISRQRAWGVPIPVLYNKRTGDPIMHKDLVDHVINLVDSESGLDAWWRLPVEDLIPANVLNVLGVPITDIVKGQDILDIWLDSGVSWLGVLGRDKVADLYLEGVDQFTGWFQSSLMTSVALRGKAPYKNVFVHGFAVDEHGLKMSKSMGNVIHPFQITNGGREEPALGVDALRWWVSSHAPQHATIPVGQGLLQSSVESVQRLRLVLKFLLGAARGPRLDISTTHNCTKLKVLDRYMLHTLALFDEEVSQLYATYQYNRVCSTVADLVAGNLSGFYLHMIKDRLYCDDTEARAGAISVLSASLGVLCKALWPIVPHLVEEAWSHYEENTNNIPMYQNPPKVEQCWFDMHTVGPIDLSLSVRSELHQIAPKQNTWKLHAEITANEEDTFLLKILQPEDHSINSELCDILQVSSVRLVEMRFDNPYVLSVTPETAPLCPRCRRHAVTTATELCTRCVTVLN